ncbi:uncharacterized protein [Watersipora subatra]|uniref:uncharacterized protein n=1 Tax=Watersipora subatra TaxID=2589382 RepID=UPI00355C8BBF
MENDFHELLRKSSGYGSQYEPCDDRDLHEKEDLTLHFSDGESPGSLSPQDSCRRSPFLSLASLGELKLSSSCAIQEDPLVALHLSDPFSQQLQSISKEINAGLSTIYLPAVTAISCLMGKSTVNTYTDLSFKEPNIIWSLVESIAGCKRHHTIDVIREALEHVDQSEGAGELPLFSANQVIEKLSGSNDPCLFMSDNLPSLNETLKAITKPCLINGIYRGSYRHVNDTRINFAGFAEPGQLRAKSYIHLHDRLLMSKSVRMCTSFEDIGPKVPEEKSLAPLFLKVYQNHHIHIDGQKVKQAIHQYTLSKEAEEVFITFHNSIIQDTHPSGLYADTFQYLNKTSGHVFRLSMPLQAAHDVHANRAPSFTIDKEVMEVAVRLVKEFEKQKLDILGIDRFPSTLTE